MSGRRARARTATKARAMKGDARAARRIYLRFNRSKRAGDRAHRRGRCEVSALKWTAAEIAAEAALRSLGVAFRVEGE